SHGNAPGDTLSGRGNRGGRGRGGLPGDSTGRARGRGGVRGADIGPSQCHDITVYPAIHLAAGACISYGLLLDISDPVHPRRLQAVTDSNFALWHSATFSNDGSRLLFTDEWGGGTSPRCRAIDPLNWGGDVVFDLKNRHLTQGAFYKMPAAQTETENCVAHNGGLLPVPGRDILVQGWYQGGISIVDFSDARHPFEIAYFDRGPINADTLYVGGFWGAYFYNGHVYASEIYRGLDVFDLTPTEFLSQNEIDAARLVHFDQLDPQTQPKIVWPAAFPVARAYLDQLVRDNGLNATRTSAIAHDLDAAEKLSGSRQRAALRALAKRLDRDAKQATDAARVRALATAVRNLSAAAR
ncbi:MAG: LVIVD repeat-containing protein, partial [Gemmatimonadales bacterium]